MNKKYLKIIIGIVIIVAIIIACYFIFIYKSENVNIDKKESKVPKKDIHVTGMLKDYLEKIGNKNYIKYIGEYVDENGKKTAETIVECTNNETKFAIKSTDLNMHFVYKENVLYTISERYKLIAKIPLSSYDTYKFNLISDFSQMYVSAKKEKDGSREYDVEEYEYNGNNISYYFLQGEVKKIKFNDNVIRVIRVEKNVNSSLFELPKGYSNM